MKHYEVKVVPATTRETLVRTSCDCCGEDAAESGNYVVDEIEIYYKTGSSFPEGGWGEIIKMDMCGECFTNKLLPFLKTIGTPRTEDWDW